MSFLTHFCRNSVNEGAIFAGAQEEQGGVCLDQDGVVQAHEEFHRLARLRNAKPPPERLRSGAQSLRECHKDQGRRLVRGINFKRLERPLVLLTRLGRLFGLAPIVVPTQIEPDLELDNLRHGELLVQRLLNCAGPRGEQLQV